MSSAVQFYLAGVLVVAGVTIIACWGLDLQIGTAGVLNFGFIVFQAAGAYTFGLLTMGPASGNTGQLYVGGTRLPFPVALIGAGVAGGIVAVPVGLLGLRRLRSDYQAIVFLVVSVIATDVVENARGLVNGAAGLSLVPQPLASVFHLQGTGYLWFYCVVVAVVGVLVWLMLRRITDAPLGRALRAVRESEQAAVALGKNVNALRLLVFVIGGVLAGLSGGLYIGYLGAWAPSGWLYPETFVFVTAIIVGGRGNKLGVLIGAVVVPAFGEVSQFLPGLGDPLLAGAIQWMFVGVLLLVFLWWLPQGIVPERKRVFPGGLRLLDAPGMVAPGGRVSPGGSVPAGGPLPAGGSLSPEGARQYGGSLPPVGPLESRGPR
ncbi:MAG: branched-chain amino acid ABC transporter permease [Acidimicrobiales bacterium]